MGSYSVKIDACPFQTGAGAANDQAAVGPRTRMFTVKASDFAEAYRMAQAIQAGIKSHDKIWEAPIRSVDFTGEQPMGSVCEIRS